MPQAALISSVGSSVSKTVLSQAKALGPSSLPARNRSRRCAQAGSTFIPRLPCCSCWTRWRTSVSILLASITRWKWSSTILACGNARRIPDAYGADGSIATTATPSRNSLLCKAIQASTHAPDRPGASPMIPAGWAGSRSTIEVIHGSLRAQPVSLKNQRTGRARVSSMPIIVVGAACPSAATAVATRMRCTVHHATPNSPATSLIARFVAVTAALTLARSRVVNRDRAGTWSLTSVNDPREHNASVHTKRRLQTHSRSGTLPCGRSFNWQTGRSFNRDDITPHEGQPPSLATLSTSTSRPPSGSSVTFRTRNPGSANSNVVRSIMARGSLQLTALGTNSISRPRASNLGAAPLKYQEPSMYPQPPPAEVRAAHSPA